MIFFWVGVAIVIGIVILLIVGAAITGWFGPDFPDYP